VPNAPATPNRNVRIPDELWDEVRRIAEDLGISRSELVRRAIHAFVRRYPL